MSQASNGAPEEQFRSINSIDHNAPPPSYHTNHQSGHHSGHPSGGHPSVHHVNHQGGHHQIGSSNSMPRAAPPSGFPVRNSASPPQWHANVPLMAPSPACAAAPSAHAAGPNGRTAWHLASTAQIRGNQLYGGYAGPELEQFPLEPRQLSRTQSPAAAPQHEGSEDLIRRFTAAVHAVPPQAVVPAAEMDHEIYSISIIINHRKTLVANLNEICRAMRLGTQGPKKDKQERVLALAKKLRLKNDAASLHSLYQVVETHAPPELRQPNGDHNNLSQQRAPPARQSFGGGRPLGEVPLQTNPLARPDLELSFRISPFYQLGQSLRPPILFLKPHTRRKITQVVPFECNAAVLNQDNSHVFLACQEYIPRANDQRPVYFPFYNELELDDEIITANTRGVRGLPGSARPVDLKPILQKKLNLRRHKLKISVIVNDQGEKVSDKSFAFGIYYGFKVPHESLVDQIKARPHFPLEHTKRMAMQAAKQDDDDAGDVVMSAAATYSLKDNVMMTRIEVPIRSKLCTHIECFDALSFVMLQDQAETWKCPICNRILTWESLAVDDFFSEILQAAGPEVESVAIKADGTWSVEDTESMDEDDSDSDNDRPPTKRARLEEDEVVDLLSDTEDEEPPTSGTAPHQNKSTEPHTEPNGESNSESNRESNREPSREPNGGPNSEQNDQPNGQSNGQPSSDPSGPSNGASNSEDAEDAARREIYATIRAFHKSHNMMFDAPLQVSEEYTASHNPTNHPTPHISSLISSMLHREPPQPRQQQQQHDPRSKSQPVMTTQPPPAVQPPPPHAPARAVSLPMLNAILDDDSEDDIIDLTAD